MPEINKFEFRHFIGFLSFESPLETQLSKAKVEASILTVFRDSLKLLLVDDLDFATIHKN